MRWVIRFLSFMWLGTISLGNDSTQPNLLVILSDDHGYQDVGFQGGKEVPTPHLDRLATTGIRFTQGYASHPFCSPTRAGLLTGRHQARFGHEYNPVYDPLDPKEGLPLSEKLLPQYLREAGYATSWVGKWHLGASPDHVPWKRGFEKTFGFIGGGHQFLGWKPNQRQYTLPLTEQGMPLDQVPEHLTIELGRRAAAFIKESQGKPWFQYVAFNAPHTPHQPTPEREAKFSHIENPQRRKYLAQVSLLDDAIGEVLAALEASGQSDRTLVIFFGDNGGPVKNGADNGSLRGQKGQVYEGGIRVPFVMRWPNRFPSGTTDDRPIISLDVLPTALAAAGISLPSDKVIDGVNLLPFLTTEKMSAPHSRLCWRAAQGTARAVREGSWKMVRLNGMPDELYDLATDPGEQRNVVSTHPEVAQKLAQSFSDWEKEMIDPVFLGSSVKSEDWGPGGANQKNGK